MSIKGISELIRFYNDKHKESSSEQEPPCQKPFYKGVETERYYFNFKSKISAQINCARKINNDYKNDGAVPNVQSGIAVLQYTFRYTREEGDLHFREESKSDIAHSKEIQKSSNVSTINHF